MGCKLGMVSEPWLGIGLCVLLDVGDLAILERKRLPVLKLASFSGS